MEIKTTKKYSKWRQNMRGNRNNESMYRKVYLLKEEILDLYDNKMSSKTEIAEKLDLDYSILGRVMREEWGRRDIEPYKQRKKRNRKHSNIMSQRKKYTHNAIYDILKEAPKKRYDTRELHRKLIAKAAKENQLNNLLIKTAQTVRDMSQDHDSKLAKIHNGNIIRDGEQAIYYFQPYEHEKEEQKIIDDDKLFNQEKDNINASVLLYDMNQKLKNMNQNIIRELNDIKSKMSNIHSRLIIIEDNGRKNNKKKKSIFS